MNGDQDTLLLYENSHLRFPVRLQNTIVISDMRKCPRPKTSWRPSGVRKMLRLRVLLEREKPVLDVIQRDWFKSFTCTQVNHSEVRTARDVVGMLGRMLPKILGYVEEERTS